MGTAAALEDVAGALSFGTGMEIETDTGACSLLELEAGADEAGAEYAGAEAWEVVSGEASLLLDAGAEYAGAELAGALDDAAAASELLEPYPPGDW